MTQSEELARLLPPAPAGQDLPRRQEHRAELLTIIAADRRRTRAWPTAVVRRRLGPALAALAVAVVAVLAVAIPALTRSGATQPAVHRTSPALPASPSRLTSARHWSVPAATFRAISVSIDRGSVTIRGGGGAAAAISAAPHYHGQPPVLTTAVIAGTLSVTVRCPQESRCQVVLTLTVPASVPVRAASDLGDVQITGLSGDVTASSRQGDITLTGLSGRVSATNDLGDVNLTSVSGPVTASTSEGTINATGLTATHAALSSQLGDVNAVFTIAPVTVTASSQLGDVALQLPSTATYDVTASTGLGSTSVTVPRSAGSPHVVRASSQLGSVTVAGS